MGDQLELPVLFWGNGRHLVEAFAKALRALGPVGFHRGQGLFDLVAVEAVASGGEKVRIWDEGQRIGRWVLPIQDALWWLEVQDDLAENVAMDFVTPARVMSQGRPLFRASFSQIFPFLLRRVTSMLFAHCDLEVVSDSSPLLASARQVEVLESTLAWRDWRVLGEGVKEQDLGGLAGSMILGAKSLGEVDWVLRLASLFNIGKGAAYGAGHFSLSGRSASR
ncbi:CRISPR system precrRNA processing endoribonuclease RAMP protein Cas6 [Desulfuromonas sp.]|uniref:CRISPR system precrRNA processing endoribonuclease RAMP protein Cas6 n=1 Tax=Desulfuromonas sp. TaxID=892 RepID=UPI0025C5C98D|nr:CRISPR system precrRNA processing endoribonuclease RAMP protein Cas6 [Desulfuromonas sp.]